MATLKGTFHINDLFPVFALAERRGLVDPLNHFSYLYSFEAGDRVTQVCHVFQHLQLRYTQLVWDKLGSTKADYRSLSTWKD